MGRFSLLKSLSVLTLLLPAAFSSPFPSRKKTPDTTLPLVIWHGLGDDFARDGLKDIAHLADEVNPGTWVHIIQLSEEADGDREATFLGNVTMQIEQVCKQLAADPILASAPAINALGLSQGGQFLRGYVERCNNPPVRNLVTLGSQHNGIMDFQKCDGGRDWVCRGAEMLLRFGRWSNFVQGRFVPAQYYRHPDEMESYLKHSNFLADINNERKMKKYQYKQNLVSLNKFVMYMFQEDQMVSPKESAHFAEVNRTTGEVTPLRERPIYEEDWLGLKTLDKNGGLEFKSVPGQHMELTTNSLKEIFRRYFGPVKAKKLHIYAKSKPTSKLVLQESH